VQPDYPEALNDVGNALVRAGRPAEAVARYEEAVRRRPGFAEAHRDQPRQRPRAARARRGGRTAFPPRPRAAPGLRRGALQLGQRPRRRRPHGGGAGALRGGREVESRQDAEALVNRGNAPARARPRGRGPARLRAGPPPSRPIYLPDASFNLASALLELGRWADAVPPLERALRRARADFPAAHRALGYALGRLGRSAEALPALTKPTSPPCPATPRSGTRSRACAPDAEPRTASPRSGDTGRRAVPGEFCASRRDVPAG
jgi:tetratricopeptide (TPR) repeat protein